MLFLCKSAWKFYFLLDLIINIALIPELSTTDVIFYSYPFSSNGLYENVTVHFGILIFFIRNHYFIQAADNNCSKYISRWHPAIVFDFYLFSQSYGLSDTCGQAIFWQSLSEIGKMQHNLGFQHKTTRSKFINLWFIHSDTTTLAIGPKFIEYFNFSKNYDSFDE